MRVCVGATFLPAPYPSATIPGILQRLCSFSLYRFGILILYAATNKTCFTDIRDQNVSLTTVQGIVPMLDDDAYGTADQSRQTDWDRFGQDPMERPPEQPRGWGCLSWLFILVLVGFMVFLRGVKIDNDQKIAPLDDTAASMQGITELQVRALIGLGELIRQLQPGNDAEIRQLFEGDPNNPGDQAQHAAMWGRGTMGQRLQYAVMGGELSGPQAALELLGRLKWDWQVAKLQPTAQQLEVFETLRKLYSDYRKKKYDAPSVGDPERQRLLAKLGWYGRLALTPPQAPDQVARNSVMTSALRLVYGMLGIVGVIVGFGILGLFGLIIFCLGTMLGGIKVGLRPGSNSSGVYAETFALWMFGFMGGQLLIELWPREQDRFILNLLIFFGSLTVLAWPVIRGLPWRQVREDIGLTWGRASILEPFWGIPGYALMVPMLAVGFAITLALLLFSAANGGGGAAPQSPFEPQHMVSHPIVDVVLRGGFWVRFQLVLLACIAAPIVEEIMFRGILYRNLRDATGGLGWFLSCAISGIWMSFIFAVIHPQGLIAVPALMGIACGCTLVREWRDSLWASMVVHAINNGLVFSLLIIAAG